MPHRLPTSEQDAVDEQAFSGALGKRIRLLRHAREWTQDDLAQRAVVSRSFISLVEKGRCGIDVRVLLRLATALGVTLPYLVDVIPPQAGLMTEATASVQLDQDPRGAYTARRPERGGTLAR
jgi:transcriptional regulator with XRE-family HTH domain